MPDVSIIMFGVPYKEDENIVQKVNDIFTKVLKVGVTVVNIERASARDGKPGAVCVELDSLSDKKQVLRAKHKCKNSKDYAKTRIKGSESHSDRVNQINCSYLLKLLGKDSDHFVVSNGLIKS